MAEHSELVAEIPSVEKMSTAERLKHAKKRRNAQLKKYAQFEKQQEKESNKRKKAQGTKGKVVKKAKTTQVKFVSNIMLLEAAARNDIAEVEQLLKGGVSPDVTNEDGLTALHQCCIDDLEDLLLLLIKYGANVNAKDSELWTPLHAAATCGHVHLCKILVDHDAELLAVNADGNMPYDICEDEITLDYIEGEMAKRGVTQDLIDDTRLSTEHKMLDDMKALVKRGEDLEFRGRSGETPLHIAAANGYIQVAEFLLEHHVQVDVTDDDTWQPIHAAACWGHLPILELLVQHGADLEARTKNGESPLDICEDPEVRQRIMEIRDEIKSHKASRSHDLRRRRSQNSRSGQAHYSSNSSLADKFSASIRRTSMREKTPLALKEAREEAQRLRESTGSADEEIEEEDKTNGPDVTETTANIFLPVEENSPADDIESVQLQLTDKNSNKTVNNREPSISNEAIPSVPVRHAVINSDTNSSKSVEMPHKSEPSGEQQKGNENLPEKRSNGTTNNVSEINKGAKTANQVADSSDTSDSQSGPANEKQEPVITAVILSTADKNSHQMSTLSSAHSEESLSNPPQGTLADLKKYRAQRLQENLRFKDNVSMHSHSEDYSSTHNHSDTENSLLTAPSGDQNKTTHNGFQYKNTYYIAEENRKHKFTASNSEIIGEDSKTGCCIIL